MDRTEPVTGLTVMNPSPALEIMNSPIKILILEDNPSDLNFLKRELNKLEFRFSLQVVETRAAFEEALHNYNPHLILSDYSLPSFNGKEAFRIKQNEYPDIPFIIVSGTIGEENAVELIVSGVTDYVLKDKLFSLNQKISRALVDAENKRQKKIADDKLRSQNEKLFEIAYMQSHQVRAPIATILGLISLIDLDKQPHSFNAEAIRKLEEAAISFDDVIREIVQKTNEISKDD